MSSTSVIAYARVSTEMQKKLSPVLQFEKIEKWAKDRGYEVIGHFSDVQSGRSARRKGLDDALRLARQTGGTLVTYDVTRLGRETEFNLGTIKKLKRAGANYASATEDVSTQDNSPAAKLLMAILSGIGQFHSDQSGEKIAAQNRATVRKLGHRTNGPQPTGWKLSEGGCRVPCEQERAVVAAVHEIFATLKKPARYAKCVNLLTARGVPTIQQIRADRNGRTNRAADAWTVGRVRRMLEVKSFVRRLNHKGRMVSLASRKPDEPVVEEVA